jgi:hypothetical protein
LLRICTIADSPDEHDCKKILMTPQEDENDSAVGAIFISEKPADRAAERVPGLEK